MDLLSILFGGASFRPQPIETMDVLEWAVIREDGRVRVTAAVPSLEESATLFGVEVTANGIQPVWLRIENYDDVDYFFLPSSLDPHYFSPHEAAWKSRFWLGGAANEAMAACFEARHIQVDIKAGEVREGFVYSNLTAGVKAFEVLLLHPGRIKWLDFLIEVPGIATDYQHVDFAALQAGGVTDVDTVTPGRLLEAPPCCVIGPDGVTAADPLNLVVIGERWHTLSSFVQRRWHVTETLSGGSVWHTAMPLVTHKIDANVDAAHDYLLTDLFFSGRLAAYGHRAGVGVATPAAPRCNYTGPLSYGRRAGRTHGEHHRGALGRSGPHRLGGHEAANAIKVLRDDDFGYLSCKKHPDPDETCGLSIRDGGQEDP